MKNGLETKKGVGKTNSYKTYLVGALQFTFCWLVCCTPEPLISQWKCTAVQLKLHDLLSSEISFFERGGRILIFTSNYTCFKIFIKTDCALHVNVSFLFCPSPHFGMGRSI